LAALAAEHPEPGHLARAGVVDDRTRVLVQLVLVPLDVLPRPPQPLLLAGEQAEPDRPLRRVALLGQGRDGAGGLQDDATAGAVVGGAGAEVPRVEVGADDYDLVRLLAPADLADRVVDRDRAGDELVVDL